MNKEHHYLYMNILRFCVASNKESLKWTGVQFDKVPTGSIRIHAGKSENLFHNPFVTT